MVFRDERQALLSEHASIEANVAAIEADREVALGALEQARSELAVAKRTRMRTIAWSYARVWIGPFLLLAAVVAIVVLCSSRPEKIPKRAGPFPETPFAIPEAPWTRVDASELANVADLFEIAKTWVTPGQVFVGMEGAGILSDGRIDLRQTSRQIAFRFGPTGDSAAGFVSEILFSAASHGEFDGGPMISFRIVPLRDRTPVSFCDVAVMFAESSLSPRHSDASAVITTHTGTFQLSVFPWGDDADLVERLHFDSRCRRIHGGG